MTKKITVDAFTSALSNAISAVSAAVTSVDAHAAAASAAATSVDARLNTVSNELSVLTASVLAISAGLGFPQMKVVTNVQGISATAGIKISGLSCAVVAGGIYQLDAKLLYSTSGTVNTIKFGMSTSGATFGGLAGQWMCNVSAINNTLTSTGVVVGNFNGMAINQVSFIPGTTGIVAMARLNALIVISTTGGTLRLKGAVSVTTAPLNIMKGSYLRAYKIA